MTHYNIVIVGAGVTGLSTAMHLANMGCDRILVLAPEQIPTRSVQSAGVALAGWLDNYTRWHHSFGEQRAQRFWQTAILAFDLLKSFCHHHLIRWQQGHRYHLGLEPSQANELMDAAELLRRQGIASRFVPERKNQANVSTDGPFSWTYPYQLDTDSAANLDAVALLKKLKQMVGRQCHMVADRAKSVETREGRLEVRTDNASYSAELVVLASHHQISDLLPSLPEGSLVPYSDQWLEVGLAKPLPTPWQAGDYASFQFGHCWASLAAQDRLQLGGARFFRPMAGIGETIPYDSDKITGYLTDKWSEVLDISSPMRIHIRQALIGVRSCDEIPLIGPLPADSRILLASGFMGQGLSLGFWAGKCLAELIQNGICEELPREYWPERLRSLDQGKPK